MKKHKINEDFFKNIDTEEKAYWLGFISADGCIYKMSKNAFRFQINLKLEDKYILESFLNSIDSDYNIDVKKISNSDVCQLKIENKNFTDNLIKHGITERKSLNVKMPIIDEKLYRHFIRGYFDGDGCISFSKRKNKNSYRYKVCIVGGYDMFNSIIEKTGINFSIYKINHSKALSLETTKKENIINFYNYIYNDCSIFLKRKKDKYDIVMSLFAEKQSKKESELTGTPLEP